MGRWSKRLSSGAASLLGVVDQVLGTGLVGQSERVMEGSSRVRASVGPGGAKRARKAPRRAESPGQVSSGATGAGEGRELPVSAWVETPSGPVPIRASVVTPKKIDGEK